MSNNNETKTPYPRSTSARQAVLCMILSPLIMLAVLRNPKESAPKYGKYTPRSGKLVNSAGKWKYRGSFFSPPAETRSPGGKSTNQWCQAEKVMGRGKQIHNGGGNSNDYCYLAVPRLRGVLSNADRPPFFIPYSHYIGCIHLQSAGAMMGTRTRCSLARRAEGGKAV